MSEFLGLSEAEMWVIITQFIIGVVLMYQYEDTPKYNIATLIVFFIGLTIIGTSLDFLFTNINEVFTTFQTPTRYVLIFITFKLLFKESGRITLYYVSWSSMLGELASRIMLPLGMYIFEDMDIAYVETVRYLFLMIGFLAVIWVMKRYFFHLIMVVKDMRISDQKIISFIVMVLLQYVATDFQFLFYIMGSNSMDHIDIFTIYRLLVCFGFVSLMYNIHDMEQKQKLNEELNHIKRLWHKQEEEYTISLFTIEMVNRKCHDFKYHVSALKEMDMDERIASIDELESYINIYDASIKTGNKALDTVLTEKNLYCKKKSINMTCTADAGQLNFIDLVDLYVIFGNALDNAIESVSKLDDVEKRVIQVSIYPEKSFIMIRIRNYCEETIEMTNEGIKTSKKDKVYHGYGLKSIKYTVEKYGGIVKVQTRNNYFKLHILIPIQEKVAKEDEKEVGQTYE